LAKKTKNRREKTDKGKRCKVNPLAYGHVQCTVCIGLTIKQGGCYLNATEVTNSQETCLKIEQNSNQCYTKT